MATPELAWTLAHGEALDLVEDIDFADDPAADDSVITLAFAPGRDETASVLRLSSAYPSGPVIEIGAFAAGAAPLVFRAGRDRIAQIAPGDYVGDLMQETPREGALAATLGPFRRRLAIVTLQIIGGTGS